MPALLPLLWANKRIIGEIVGIIVLAIIAYWFFWHNPQVIKNLENDKAELARQVAAGQAAITLLDDIQKGKARINAQVQSQISSVKSQAIPRRTVLIRAGGVLPAMYPAHAPNGTKPAPAGADK